MVNGRVGEFGAKNAQVDEETPPPRNVIGEDLWEDEQRMEWVGNVPLTPPNNGPATLAMPHVAPMKPAYLPRLSRETMSEMVIWTSWIMPPPPIP